MALFCKEALKFSDSASVAPPAPALLPKATVAGRAIAPGISLLTGAQFRPNALEFAAGHCDGLLNLQTRSATMRFQRTVTQLKPDGIPGSKTQSALPSACGY